MFQPLHDYVLVKRLENDAKTAGGIIIPETAKQTSTRGEVMAVGAGKLSASGSMIPLTVKVGDIIFFGKYIGTEMKLDHEDFVVMHESDIFGILDSVSRRG